MRLWVDDTRQEPNGYIRCTNVNETKIRLVQHFSHENMTFYGIEELNLDHDSGDYRTMGGDYIEILKWLEEKQNIYGWKINFPIRIHSMNPVGRENMRTIIQKNNWKEVL